jgi:hypothetical protein
VSAVLAVAWLGAGCAPESAEKKQAPAKTGRPAATTKPTRSSAARDVIDTMTGRTAVNSGLKARDVIVETSAEKKANLEEAYKIGGGQ